ncbi:universal stress protein [Vitreimonas sp.]|uniref:universal stress protein n=1 Tax=Vitreimonas sp. TaxID=3069702 RepID=UPI002ED7B49B
MAYKDILAPVITLEADESALTAAAEIAHAFETRATALIVAVHVASAFADQERPFSEVLADVARGTRNAAALERTKIVDWLEAAVHNFEVRDLTIEAAVDQNEVLAHARVTDLVVMARAETHAHARRALIEHVLFEAGRPLLLVPSAPRKPRAWKRALIGWNAKAQSMRAVSAALPLLQRAEAVAVATVDALPSRSGHGQAPGRELAAYLARHGVQVEVRNLDSMGRTEARALLDEAEGFGAEVMVMGAYGRSRASEFVFGGVTRELLLGSPLPVLMAH